jgi:hypothetical protein
LLSGGCQLDKNPSLSISGFITWGVRASDVRIFHIPHHLHGFEINFSDPGPSR